MLSKFWQKVMKDYGESSSVSHFVCMFQNVAHQREDSHSETSGETTTSHDSGRGSVEGDNHGNYTYHTTFII